MPKAINQEALDNPNLKMLDLNKPPTMDIPYQPFPKVVYLHPVDKAKEHLSKVVNSPEELEAAQKLGWRTKPHIPQVPAEQEINLSEYEVAPKKAGN